LDESQNNSETISIGPRLIASGGFDALYREGMALIEEVAAYLDGDGRVQSRDLSREASFVYATESMRLTTRLMQLASWLLLQRAVGAGEITPENARIEKEKVKFSETPAERSGPGWEGLPNTLSLYIGKGDQLYERVVQFDQMERGNLPETQVEPTHGDVADQLSRVQAAFGGDKNPE